MAKVKHQYSVIARGEQYIVKGCDICGHHKHAEFVTWNSNITKQMVIDTIRTLVLNE